MPPKTRLTETPTGKTVPETSLTKTEKSKTTAEIGLTKPEKSKTVPEIGLTETGTSKTGSESSGFEPIIADKADNKVGRPPKPVSTTAVTWSVRGVERETRALLEKAAARADKTLGQYFNDEVRAFVQGELRQAEAPQLPASPRDLQVQVEQLTQMVEGIASRLAEPARKTLWQRVFGK
jgi:hypothetical protein